MRNSSKNVETVLLFFFFFLYIIVGHKVWSDGDSDSNH